MATQEEILRELEGRRDSLSISQQQVLDELLRRTATVAPEVGDTAIPPKTLGGFAGNILPSAGRLAGDIGSAIAHPIRTAGALGGLAKDVALAPVTGVAEESLGSNLAGLREHLANRYGGVEELGNTVYEDPVGFMADLSSVFSGGGAGLNAVKATGTAGKIGRGLSTAGRFTDPAVLAGKAVKVGVGLPLKGAGHLSAAGVGAATGSGTTAVKAAVFRNTKSFVDAMRGKITDLEIVQHARDALDVVREKRAAAYVPELEKLKTSKIVLKMEPVRAKLNSLLDDFGVKQRIAPEVPASLTPELGQVSGTPARRVLDDSVAAVDSPEIAAAVKLVDGWTDTSVIGMDRLKRRLGQLFSESSEARKFVTDLQSEVRKQLEFVPGYKKMTSEYASATEMINQIDKELSLSQPPGVAVRKLANSLNQNNSYRELIIEGLDDAAGSSIFEQAAGSTFSDIAPRGIRRPLVGTTLLADVASGNPLALQSIALSSPRMTGEILTILAGLRKGTIKVGNALPNYPGAFAYRGPVLANEADEPSPALEPKPFSY